jgi:hypothetical protein
MERAWKQDDSIKIDVVPWISVAAGRSRRDSAMVISKAEFQPVGSITTFAGTTTV